MRKGKERDKKGSGERDTGRQDGKEQAARGMGKQGERAKGRGRGAGRGYMGSPRFPGKRSGWWGGVVPPAIPPVIPPFPPPPYLAVGMGYPPPPV